MKTRKPKTARTRPRIPKPQPPPEWIPARCVYCPHDACATVQNRPACARHIPRAILEFTPPEKEPQHRKAKR